MYFQWCVCVVLLGLCRMHGVALAPPPSAPSIRDTDANLPASASQIAVNEADTEGYPQSPRSLQMGPVMSSTPPREYPDVVYSARRPNTIPEALENGMWDMGESRIEQLYRSDAMAPRLDDNEEAVEVVQGGAPLERTMSGRTTRSARSILSFARSKARQQPPLSSSSQPSPDATGAAPSLRPSKSRQFLRSFRSKKNLRESAPSEQGVSAVSVPDSPLPPVPHLAQLSSLSRHSSSFDSPRQEDASPPHQQQQQKRPIVHQSNLPPSPNMQLAPTRYVPPSSSQMSTRDRGPSFSSHRSMRTDMPPSPLYNEMRPDTSYVHKRDVPLRKPVPSDSPSADTSKRPPPTEHRRNYSYPNSPHYPQPQVEEEEEQHQKSMNQEEEDEVLPDPFAPSSADLEEQIENERTYQQQQLLEQRKQQEEQQQQQLVAQQRQEEQQQQQLLEQQRQEEQQQQLVAQQRQEEQQRALARPPLRSAMKQPASSNHNIASTYAYQGYSAPVAVTVESSEDPRYPYYYGVRVLPHADERQPQNQLYLRPSPLYNSRPLDEEDFNRRLLGPLSRPRPQ